MTAWTRIAWTSTGDPQATSVRFAIEIGAGDVVDVYGLQAELRPHRRPTEQHGAESRRRALGDVLAITTTDVNRHSCKLKVIHAIHL